jgi:hypothetical protein
MIVGVPAHDEADELIAHMLVQLLRENGCPGRVESIAHSSHDETSSHREEIVFISALPPSTLGSASRACRHIKHRNPRTKVVIGIWNGEGPIENLRRRLMPAGADAIAVRLAEAVVQLKELALGETSSPGTLPPASAKRSASTIDKRAEVKAEDVMEITLREAAQTCGVPVALVSIVETDRHFWRPYANSAEEPAATQAVVPNGDDLVSETALAVSDIAKEARYASNAALTKRGVQSFATVPLRTRGGHLVGNLCVVDTRPRDFGNRELTRLQELGAELMASLDRPEPVAAQAD